MSIKALVLPVILFTCVKLTQISGAAEVPAVSREIRSKITDARQSAIDEEQRLQREALIRSHSRLPLDVGAALLRRDALSAGESAEAKRLADANARLDAAVATASPEGRILLAQAKTADTPPEIIPPSSAKPIPLPPTATTEKPKVGPKPAVIDAESSYIDSANSITIFEGSVTADHPDFDLSCDKLEIHMPKTEKKARPAAALAGGSRLDPTKTPPPTEASAAATEAPAQGGGIDKAIATGTRVVITQHAPDGSNKIGTGRHVTYDGKTGDITLRGMPQIQDGGNMIIATAAETVLVITAEGKIRTSGPHQTKFVQADDNPKAKAKPKAPPSNPVPVSGPGILPNPGAR